MGRREGGRGEESRERRGRREGELEEGEERKEGGRGEREGGEEGRRQNTVTDACSLFDLNESSSTIQAAPYSSL